jgi:hypothetical protein
VERVATGDSSVSTRDAVLGLGARVVVVVMEVVEAVVKMRLTGSKEKEAKESLLMDGIEMEDCEREDWYSGGKDGWLGVLSVRGERE